MHIITQTHLHINTTPILANTPNPIIIIITNKKNTKITTNPSNIITNQLLKISQSNHMIYYTSTQLPQP